MIPRLTAIRDSVTACLPVAHLDEHKPPHLQELFISKQYAALRWSIFDLSGDEADYQAWLAACREAGVSVEEAA